MANTERVAQWRVGGQSQRAFAADALRRIVRLPSARRTACSSERAGRRAAAIQTVLATAKRNGLDAFRWLSEPVEKLPTCPNSKIDSLLPFAQSSQR